MTGLLISPGAVSVHFSGASDHDLERGFAGLKALARRLHLRRLVCWDTDGRTDTTECHQGSALFDGPLELEFPRLVGVSADYALPDSDALARLLVTRADAGLAVSGGFPPFEADLEFADPQRTRGHACLEFVLAAADALDARIAVFVSGTGDAMPSATESDARVRLVALPAAQIDEATRERLRSAGAIVDAPDERAVAVWLLGERSFAPGRAPTEELLRHVERLLRGPAR
ncbi:hypothetical protein [Nannocystis bainbridge]|uniref:Uncharacterized protein n=1 Tax=Nannocystis bainbridge TaxID=2995303 RepID=A0ABT5DS65_9BACT|nr:hypothetical protein [Nannocystis bainbridge]MDC0716475.1 hypothetical protein [Nannocystis bainbridge]